MRNILYHILGCAVSGRNLEVERLKNVTPKEWHEVYLMGKAQGVTGLVFDKVKTLPKDMAPPKELVFKWMSHSLSIEMQTKGIFQRCAGFAQLMHEHGLHTLVLKGVAVSQYYPNPWYREYGDLDCYLYRLHNDQPVWDGCYEEGNSISENDGCVVKRGFYKHSHINYKGLEVENHQFALPIKDGAEVRDLERELRRLVSSANHLKQIGQTYLYAPSADFTALFLTAHSLSHFLFESIKLRHVLDWAFFVKAEHGSVDWNNFWKWCDRMKYTRFVMCLNHICVHYLKMELPKELYKQGDEKISALSERILDDIFGGYSLYTQNHTGLMHRVMIIKSYLKGIWKFNEVHQRNAFWLMARRIKNYWVKDVRL